MRQITDHKIAGLNESLTVIAVDDGGPGPGGANHHYIIYEPLPAGGPGEAGVDLHIRFQNGTVADEGINGVSNEALLAVVIDRIRSFQSGPFACRENAVALTNLEQAMMWLHKRTRDRLARGVEGKLKA